MAKTKDKSPELNYRIELYKILTSPYSEIDKNLAENEKKIFEQLFLGEEMEEKELIKKILGNDKN